MSEFWCLFWYNCFDHFWPMSHFQWPNGMSHGYLDGRSDGTRFARSTQGQLHPAPRGVAVERARLPGRSRGGRGKWTGWPRQTMRWKQWIYHSIYFLSISIYIYLYLSISLSLSLSVCLSVCLCLSLWNEAILRDFLKKWLCTVPKPRNSARLAQEL